MKKSGVWGILAAFLIISIMGIATIHPANAQVLDGDNDIWDDSQIQEFNSLIGTEITAGQLYEKVDPKFLDSLPSDLRESYYKTKVKWPVAPGMDIESGKKTDLKMNSDRLGQVTLNFGTFATPIGTAINYFSQSVSNPPTTFVQMYDKSTLIRYENGHYYYVDHRSGTGYLCTLHYVSGLKSVSPGTYVVLGEHSGISLPGILDPPIYGPVYSQSSYVTIY